MLHKRDSKSSGPISVAPSQNWDGTDGLWSSFPLQVGHPAQDVRVFPSTAAAEIWVVTAAAGCPDGMPLPSGTGATTCSDSRGRLFNENTTVTWVPNSLYTLGVEKSLAFDSTAYYGYDTVTMGWQGANGPTLDHQIIAELADPNYWIGGFGLNPRPTNFTTFVNPQPSPLQTLKNNNQISSVSYGYTAGAYYRFNHVLGSLTLGGYDASLFKSNKVSIPHAPDDSRDLVASIQGIKSSTSTDSLLPSGPISTFVDSTLGFIYLPTDSCKAFERAFNLTYNNDWSLYLIDNHQHDALLKMNPTITFTIGSSTSGGPTVDIDLPYASFDLSVSYPWIDQDMPTSRYFPLRRADNDTQYTLGRTFLQEAYLTVDYDRKVFNLAQRTWNDQGTPSAKLVTIHPPGYSAGLSKGALIGIIVGVVALLALLLSALTYFLLRRRRRRRQQKEQKEEEEKAAALASRRDRDRDRSGSRRRPNTSSTSDYASSASSDLIDRKSVPGTSVSTHGHGHNHPSSRSPATPSDSDIISPLSPSDNDQTHMLDALSRPRHEMGTSCQIYEAPGAEAKWGSARKGETSAKHYGNGDRAGGEAARPLTQQELQGSGPGAWEADSNFVFELQGCEAPLGMSEKLGGARLVGYDGRTRLSSSSRSERPLPPPPPPPPPQR